MIAHVTDVGGGGSSGGGPLRLLMLIGGLGVLALAAKLRASQGAKDSKAAKGAKGKDKPWLPWVVGGLGLAMAVFGLVTPTKKNPEIYLTLLEPEPGATVAANQDVTLQVQVEGAKVAATPTAKEGGHLHLYVDDKLQSMPYGTNAAVRLTPGRHTLKVEFVDEKHVAYKPPIAVEAMVIAQ